MMDEIIHLSWLSHKAALTNILPTLRLNNTFCDVTLCCNGMYFPTHRIILSTYSDYFKEILEMVPCRHPFIIIQDIYLEDLQNILDFIYVGETSVAHCRMDSFLKAAKTLRIKGLDSTNLNGYSFSEYPTSENNKEGQQSIVGAPLDCNVDIKHNFQTFDEPLNADIQIHSNVENLALKEILNSNVEENPLDLAEPSQIGSLKSSANPLEISRTTQGDIALMTNIDVAHATKALINQSAHEGKIVLNPLEINCTSQPISTKENSISAFCSDIYKKKAVVVLEPCKEAIKLSHKIGKKKQIQKLGKKDVPNRNNSEPHSDSEDDHSYEDDYNNIEMDEVLDQSQNIPEVDKNFDGLPLLTSFCRAELNAPNPNKPSTSYDGSLNFSGFSQGSDSVTVKREILDSLQPNYTVNEANDAEESDPIGINKTEETNLRRVSYNLTMKPNDRKKKLKRFKYGNKKRIIKKRKDFFCHFCPYKASQPNYLNVHLRTHTGEKPYHCTLCSYKSTQKSALNTHMLTHEVTLIKCDLCSFETKKCSDMEEHKNTHYDNITYSCDKCSFVTRRNLCLEEHTKTHVTEDLVKRQAKTDIEYSNMENQNGDLLFKCRKCQFTSSSIIEFKCHKNLHNNKKYMCPLCPYKVNVKLYYERHMNLHNCSSFDSVYRCDVCTYITSSKYQLLNHLENHTRKKLHKCEICEYQAGSTSGLYYHKRRHHFNKKHISLTKKIDKTNHENSNKISNNSVNTNDLNDKCYSEENKESASVPKDSIKGGPSGRIFRCTNCYYITTHKSQLVYHQFIHKEVKSFKCQKCNFKSRSMSNLKNHEKMHSSKTVFKKSKSCGDRKAKANL